MQRVSFGAKHYGPLGPMEYEQIRCLDGGCSMDGMGGGYAPGVMYAPAAPLAIPTPAPMSPFGPETQGMPAVEMPPTAMRRPMLVAPMAPVAMRPTPFGWR